MPHESKRLGILILLRPALILLHPAWFLLHPTLISLWPAWILLSRLRVVHRWTAIGSERRPSPVGQPVHRLEEQAAKALRGDGDRDFGVGEAAPLAAPVDNRRAGCEPARSLDVHGGAARFDQSRIKGDGDC